MSDRHHGGNVRGRSGTRITIPMIARMRALRAVGLSAEATARVISLDWGLPVTKEQVRSRVPLGRGWSGKRVGDGITCAGITTDNVANFH